MTGLWDAIFDRVYVVSLPQSVGRRAYVAEHLSAHGFAHFDWHDAFDPSHAEVRALFDGGRVHTFPPCFRCGLTSCGEVSCNNVLLPVQVAVFATHLALWRKIAVRGECALIVEDDVRFHDAWRFVLPALRTAIQSSGLPFTADQRCLLRLGWALGPDHDQPGPVRYETTIRMSNPCYAMTPAFAEKAVAAFSKVATTADIYLHAQLPEGIEAITVFPPIASELSWSTGAVDSLIHPKTIRADYLDAQGAHAAAQETRQKVARHFRHIEHRAFLVTGHPGAGLGSAAALLQNLGLDIGHETAGRDGLASWMFAANAEEYPFAKDPIITCRRSLYWETLLHVVENPLHAIPHIIAADAWTGTEADFRAKAILEETGLDLRRFESAIDRAVLSLAGWSRMVESMRPDLSFRIEDAETTLAAFLSARGRAAAHQGVVSRNVGGREGDGTPPPPTDWATLSAEARDSLNWYCDRYGYVAPS